MSASGIETTAVDIAGRKFEIKCPKDKINELHNAANYLNGKMQEVQRGNKLTTIDHVVVTAALNVSHELLAEKQRIQSDGCDVNKINERFSKMHQKLNEVLVAAFTS